MSCKAAREYSWKSQPCQPPHTIPAGIKIVCNSSQQPVLKRRKRLSAVSLGICLRARARVGKGQHHCHSLHNASLAIYVLGSLYESEEQCSGTSQLTLNLQPASFPCSLPQNTLSLKLRDFWIHGTSFSGGLA